MSNQEPAFTAYAVTKREGEDDWWNAIGAAFPHADGKGYNVILGALPVDGKVVLRTPRTAPEKAPERTETHRGRESRERHRPK